MAIKRLKSGKYQADWRDERGVRQRKAFPNKVLAECFLSQQRLFDSAEGKAHQVMNFRQMTVAELADKYLKEHLQFSRAKNNKGYVNVIKEKWGSDKLFRVSQPEVRQWILGLIHEPDDKNKYALASVKKILAYFKRLFNWAKENDLIHQNPIDGVNFKKEFKRITRRNVVIESEQFWKLVDKFPSQPAYLRQVCIAAWCTGMREGEIINLKWHDVDLQNGLIRLGADQTKESDIKTIGIESELKEILTKNKAKNSPNDECYVFTSSVGHKIDGRCLSRTFRKHADRAGYANLRLHDFRHCYTTRKRREGFDRSLIKAQTGHHTDSMFYWYDNVDEQEIQAMSGHSHSNAEILKGSISLLVQKAKKKNISLGAVQNLVGRLWRAKAA
jgi:integrase